MKHERGRRGQRIGGRSSSGEPQVPSRLKKALEQARELISKAFVSVSEDLYPNTLLEDWQIEVDACFVHEDNKYTWEEASQLLGAENLRNLKNMTRQKASRGLRESSRAKRRSTQVQQEEQEEEEEEGEGEGEGEGEEEEEEELDDASGDANNTATQRSDESESKSEDGGKRGNRKNSSQYERDSFLVSDDHSTSDESSDDESHRSSKRAGSSRVKARAKCGGKKGKQTEGKKETCTEQDEGSTPARKRNKTAAMADSASSPKAGPSTQLASPSPADKQRPPPLQIYDLSSYAALHEYEREHGDVPGTRLLTLKGVVQSVANRGHYIYLLLTSPEQAATVEVYIWDDAFRKACAMDLDDKMVKVCGGLVRLAKRPMLNINRTGGISIVPN